VKTAPRQAVPPQPSTGAPPVEVPRMTHHICRICANAVAHVEHLCLAPRYTPPATSGVLPHTATHPAPTTPIIRATRSRRVARGLGTTVSAICHSELCKAPDASQQRREGDYYSCQDPQSDAISSNSYPLPYFPAGREPVDWHAVRSRNAIKMSVTRASSDGSAYLLLHSPPLGLSFC
jgi:hypothetical protein